MHTFENEIMNLVDALKSEMREGDGTTLQRTKTYLAGEYVYGIQIDNRLSGGFKVDIYMQWPRLHCWIAEQQHNGVQLECRHSALCPDDVHVHVCKLGSLIEYTAIIEKSTVLDMLLSSTERDAILEQHPYSELDKMAAEDLWNLVMCYECL